MAGRVIDRRTLLTGAAALSVAPTVGYARTTHPIALSRHGPVRGALEDGVAVFRGIRYGADTASTRFQPPQAPEPWRDPVDALSFGHASPQRGDEPDPSEDCLFLNVWTPGCDAGRRPVMVYIHGGAYASGSGSSALYDGTRLARDEDVVVVTLNHRLGPLGYAYLARIAGAPFLDSGAVGQLDLILALEWIRDSIAGFGGDPARVMVFGQSGGGAKIATLMATPRAVGLFHRAATMSGQQVTMSGPLNATRRAEAWLSALGLTRDRVAEVARLPVERLLEAAGERDPVLGYGSLYFGPVLDERTHVRHPFFPDAPGQSAGIPMIIGNTHDETRAFHAGDRSLDHLTWEDLPDRLSPDQLRIDVAPEAVIAEYRRLYPAYSPSEVFFAATTAGRSWRAAVIEAEERARQGSPAYAYQLDWASDHDGGRLGAPHTSDIRLVFKTLEAPPWPATGPGAAAMADHMSRAFAAFARTGDPNHAGLPIWPPYDLARRQTMIFDDPPRMQDDPRGAERRFFARIPYVQPGT